MSTPAYEEICLKRKKIAFRKNPLISQFRKIWVTDYAVFKVSYLVGFYQIFFTVFFRIGYFL